MAAVAIDFNGRLNDRNMGKRIRIVGDIHNARCAGRMATRRRTAGCHTRVIEARGAGKRGSGVARAAIRVGYDVRWRFASGTENGARMAGRT